MRVFKVLDKVTLSNLPGVREILNLSGSKAIIRSCETEKTVEVLITTLTKEG